MQKFINRYIILTTVLITFSLVILWLQYKQAKHKTAVDISNIPFTIGEWRGEDIPVDEQTKNILETNSVLMRQYTNQKGDVVVLAVVYYKDSRVALHLPESCLLGHGSRLTDRELERITLSNGESFDATKLAIKNDFGNNLLVYYFETGIFRSPSYFLFRWHILLNKLKGNSSSGALVRFSMGTTGDNLQYKLDELKNFISGIGIVLPKYLI